ncbi:hypothetical protein [Methanoculleus chikugoensis]|uniref:Uncharacterized protein n=1 Tax=Methanoculleus chikugoensis TaxID=118126 RepID=A0ABM7H2T5_9EURY|nr:hypothetical protein [Methanoculleus chikugoensis]BBL67099.1 hypothetical protein MchiMG62_02800 [Methanoculleus chikugoensis]
MEPDRKRLIALGVFAFIGVVVLVAVTVFGVTTLIALITGVDGPPKALTVEVVGEGKLQNASVIHLTDRDLKQHPVLAAAIREAGNESNVVRSASVPMTEVECLALTESFGVYTANAPILEYDGVYYATRVLLH